MTTDDNGEEVRVLQSKSSYPYFVSVSYTHLDVYKRQAHLFPSVQQDMADQLDAENMNEESNDREGGLAYVS